MAKLDDNSLMPFGKHRDKAMTNVPAGYLMYIYDNNMILLPKYQNVKDYIEENISVIKAQVAMNDKKHNR